MAWAHVKGAKAEATSGTTLGCTFGSGCAVGNRIIVAVVAMTPPGICSGVADGVNTYTEHVANNANGDGTDVSIWSAVATSTATLTVTATFSGGPPVGLHLGICVEEYSGLSQTSGAGGVDKTASSHGTTTTPTSTATAVTTAANELVIGVMGDGENSGPITAGTGFTIVQSFADASVDIALEEKDSGLSGTTQTATFGIATNLTPWSCCAAVFKLAPFSLVPKPAVARQAVNRAATF